MLGKLNLVNVKARVPDGVLSPASPRDDDCAICLAPLHSAVVTSCGHHFHSTCILAHVHAATSGPAAVIRCPTCRGVLMASGNRVENPHRHHLQTPMQPRGASTRTLCGVTFDVCASAGENVLITSLWVGGAGGRLLVLTPRACESQRAAGTDWRRSAVYTPHCLAAVSGSWQPHQPSITH